MTAPIPLNRRFVPWTDRDSGDPEVMSHLLAFNNALTWEGLLAKHRVVVLAEAGSGKSTELAEQARLSEKAGRYTFFATVQSVGRQGLSGALGRSKSRKLEEWRTSDEPAWFFLDSVDEAKANDVRLDDALKEIADGIEGVASRTHIVLSGRHTDWEFRRDLERLNARIPMPPPDAPAPAIDPNELIVSVLRRDKPPEPPPPAEAPLVVVMGALDRGQIDAFARGKGVANVDVFFLELDKVNLWDFARRPLDLDWLVGYWRTHGALGSLADMLDLSLRQRLLEPDPQRARTDPIDADRAMAALERIGAALVLQRLQDVTVPDSGLDLAAGRPALNLAEILPDWSGEHQTRLINRAAFDPASAGFARLHNDNQGIVRSFLTARWLKGLTKANCPKAVVDDLLFATTYDVPLVIPSMRQTAAWLSLWDPHVAREVIARDPRLLMDAGDPASLRQSVREQVLKAVVAQVIDDEEVDIPDRDSLKRFALPDMAPCLRELWAAHDDSPAVRELLLLMIWLGELTSCADLACEASFGTYSDRYSQVFSGRALMATASGAEKRRYAVYVRDNAGEVPSVLVWDAVEALFPTILSVDDFLLILKSVDVTDRSGGLDLDLLGPRLAQRLGSAAQSERLIEGLLDRLQASLNPADEQELPQDEPFLSTLEATGRRLLQLVPSSDAPPLAIDAALRLGEERRHKPWRRGKESPDDVFSLLQQTPQRRRAALWRAVERFTGASVLGGKPITDIWQIEFLGFAPGLKREDFDWLMEDAEHRSSPADRQIAANAALKLWHEDGRPPDQLARIEAVGGCRPEVAAAIDNWTRPRSLSEEERAYERRTRRWDQRNAAVSAKRDQSWREFADRLRADPNQLRSLKPPTDKGVDARLFHLWEFLRTAGSNRSRYAIDDLTTLEPMFGAPVVAALRDAFVAYWRHWSPTLRSERPKDKQNTINALDCIGIVGVTLEAARDPNWAAALSYHDAIRAAIYGTLELNGFPAWLVSLAQAQPDAVREVLAREVAPDLSASGATNRREALEDVSRAHVAISSLFADQLFDHLSRNEALPTTVLAPMLRILQAGYKDRATLAALLRARFERTTILKEEVVYIEALFALAPGQASAALDAKLALSQPDEQTLLVQSFLSKWIGRGWMGSDDPIRDLPFESLERLVVIAFRTIRVEDDNDRPSGQVYSPDERDNAEQARSALFRAFVDTPGLATFDAILRLRDTPGFPVRRKRLIELARDRAEKDSEPARWSSADVCAFESDFLIAPRSPRDLQRLALARLDDLQFDLLNSDYAQGATVASLPHEVNVQTWVADRLRRDQGRSYSVEREPHVVEEKEPDIRFRARVSDANVPMEIKVAESWTLEELEDALSVQLVGRYLRDRHNRYGILLLVHQSARPKGWRTTAGNFLSFEQAVSRLRTLARSIAANGSAAPQAKIAVIDVSSASPEKKPQAKVG
jgi:hypothetical protein